MRFCYRNYNKFVNDVHIGSVLISLMYSKDESFRKSLPNFVKLDDFSPQTSSSDALKRKKFSNYFKSKNNNIKQSETLTDCIELTVFNDIFKPLMEDYQCSKFQKKNFYEEMLKKSEPFNFMYGNYDYEALNFLYKNDKKFLERLGVDCFDELIEFPKDFELKIHKDILILMSILRKMISFDGKIHKSISSIDPVLRYYTGLLTKCLKSKLNKSQFFNDSNCKFNCYCKECLKFENIPAEESTLIFCSDVPKNISDFFYCDTKKCREANETFFKKKNTQWKVLKNLGVSYESLRDSSKDPDMRSIVNRSNEHNIIEKLPGHSKSWIRKDDLTKKQVKIEPLKIKSDDVKKIDDGVDEVDINTDKIHRASFQNNHKVNKSMLFHKNDTSNAGFVSSINKNAGHHQSISDLRSVSNNSYDGPVDIDSDKSVNLRKKSSLSGDNDLIIQSSDCELYEDYTEDDIDRASSEIATNFTKCHVRNNHPIRSFKCDDLSSILSSISEESQDEVEFFSTSADAQAILSELSDVTYYYNTKNFEYLNSYTKDAYKARINKKLNNEKLYIFKLVIDEPYELDYLLNYYVKQNEVDPQNIIIVSFFLAPQVVAALNFKYNLKKIIALGYCKSYKGHPTGLHEFCMRKFTPTYNSNPLKFSETQNKIFNDFFSEIIQSIKFSLRSKICEDSNAAANCYIINPVIYQ